MASGHHRRGKGNRGRKGDSDPDVRLSKFLSYICRHGAEGAGIHVHEGGYVNVKEVLRLPQGKQWSEGDVRRVVAGNDKQRFALRETADGDLQIRANQGHTMQVDGLELSPILKPEDAPTVVHGTYRRAWDSIKVQGLSRMQRNHIHFAAGLPGESGVISGMRSSCQLLVYINMEKALEDGFKFYRSANNVILCPGNEDGFLPSGYFKEVREYPSGKLIPL